MFIYKVQIIHPKRARFIWYPSNKYLSHQKNTSHKKINLDKTTQQINTTETHIAQSERFHKKAIRILVILFSCQDVIDKQEITEFLQKYQENPEKILTVLNILCKNKVSKNVLEKLVKLITFLIKLIRKQYFIFSCKHLRTLT